MVEGEAVLWRILSGRVRVRLGEENTLFLLGPVSPEQRLTACEIYQDSFQEAQEEGLMDEQELYAYLCETGAWDDKSQERLDRAPKDIEDFKVGLYNAAFKSEERKAIRKVLKAAKESYADLYARRHGQDSLSCLGTAATAKSRYLTACMLRTARDLPFFHEQDLRELSGFWAYSGELIDLAVAAWAAASLSEQAIRETARLGQWKEIWNARRATGPVFPSPLGLTEEQKSLLQWSLLYEDVAQHPDCPPDEVVEDDDMLDGWLIVQKKKRGEDAGKRQAEDLIGKNEKIRNSEEVFVLVNGPEDVKKIDALNSERSAAVKRQRLEQVKKAGDGEISEYDFADMKQRRRMEAARLMNQRGGGK